jgi:hypothetical protein
MNGEQEHAVGILCEDECAELDSTIIPPSAHSSLDGPPPMVRPAAVEDHWGWRMSMAESIAAQTDPERFGVKGMWVYGSTKNATAGADADLDLLVHFAGDEGQRKELLAWLEGWGRALSEANFRRTGRRVVQLLDVVLVSDEDILERRGVAAKVDAVTDAARSLKLGGR